MHAVWLRTVTSFVPGKKNVLRFDHLSVKTGCIWCYVHLYRTHFPSSCHWSLAHLTRFFVFDFKWSSHPLFDSTLYDFYVVYWPFSQNLSYFLDSSIKLRLFYGGLFLLGLLWRRLSIFRLIMCFSFLGAAELSRSRYRAQLIQISFLRIGCVMCACGSAATCTGTQKTRLSHCVLEWLNQSPLSSICSGSLRNPHCISSNLIRSPRAENPAKDLGFLQEQNVRHWLRLSVAGQLSSSTALDSQDRFVGFSKGVQSQASLAVP